MTIARSGPQPSSTKPADAPTDTDLSLLTLLAKGYEFDSAVTTLGDAGIKACWHCLLNGWIDSGSITVAGRALVPLQAQQGRLQAPKFVVTDQRTGRVVSTKS